MIVTKVTQTANTNLTCNCVKCKTRMELVSDVMHERKSGYSLEFWCEKCKTHVELEITEPSIQYSFTK